MNPESDERDLANVERLRPQGQFDRMRTDAQIAGHMSFGNIPEELWPFMPPTNTALEQVKRNYEARQAEQDVDNVLADAEAKTEEVKDSAVRTEEEQAADLEKEVAMHQRLAKAREVLKKKREEEKQLNESLEAVSDSAV